ncbi:MAG: DUF4331 domain-containing protein [Deltaproteobacteria bacterium]|nr:DUF4331 domain-containing protein [Deltaproteobacteria bacterium]
MRKFKKNPICQVVAIFVAAVMTLSTASPIAWAASHREAPLIALDPAADNTDTYAFRSWEDPSKVVFIMNVIPGQEPGDGPNYFNFDDDVLYRMHIDHNQDGVAEDIVYEFKFKTETRPALGSLNFPLPYVGNSNIPVSGLQGITKLDGPGSEGLTRRQTFTVTEVRSRNGKRAGDSESGRVGGQTQLFKGQTLVAVPSNVGPATMPKYEDLASQGIYSDPETGIRVFTGQRAETFYIDLGAVFDTVNLRRFPPVLSEAEDTNDSVDPFGVNRFSGFNVHSIAIEVPIDRITVDSKGPKETETPVIGMYASTSRQKIKQLRGDGTSKTEGKFVQTSRLANPLVNELIIDTPLKDRWNASEPEDEAQFQQFYQNPSLALALNLIFGLPVPATPRTDLINLFLKYPGQSLNGNTCGQPCAELLRVNLSVDPTLPESQKRLGGLAGDAAGFPNGRRPNDDVTDIATRVVGGDVFITNRVGDGVNFLGGAPGAGVNDGPGYGAIPGNRLDVTLNGIAKEFPYLPTPYDGVRRRHIDCVQNTGAPCIEQ